MSEDTRPSRLLTAFAAFGGFWAVMSVGLLLGYAFDADPNRLRDYLIPASFLVAFVIYSEARFKRQ